jgi:glycosyltransferase involved in cell wall biosynthesis
MHIGVNTLFLIPGEVGGSETYLRRTLSAMATLFPDVGLVLFTNRENDPVLRKDLSSFPQVEFQLLNFRAANRFMRIIREQTELPVRVKKSDIDVLWSPGYTAPFFCHCPQIVTIHDMQYIIHPEDLTLSARLATRILVRAAARCCNRIIAISEFSKNEIANHTSAEPSRIKVVHNGVDTSMFGTTPKKYPNGYPSIEIKKAPYILSVANTYPHKGIHILVDAFGEIMDSIENNLVLVGLSRLGEGRVKKAINRLEDKNRIIRLSKLSTDKLAALYRGADLFVFPSLYEGFGLPVLEAMMAGTPVVTTRMGSIPEVGGDHVVYADPPDAQSIANRMIEVLGWSPEQRLNWIQKAKVYASRFTWEKTARETMKVLKQGVMSREQRAMANEK